MSRADRLLPWIAAERTARALLLIGVGIVLLANLHHDYGGSVRHVARSFGLDPTRGGIQRLAAKAGALRPRKVVEYGAIALGYGALELAEGYGLWRRRHWAEVLTVVATSLLIIPEVWELTKKPTVLKAAGLAVNVAIVAYLVRRLRRQHAPVHAPSATRAG